MLRLAGRAFSDDPPLLHAVVEMMPKIREAGNEMEQMRRIPPHIAEAMKETGVFGMVLPRSWGAPELDPLTQIRAIEALAIAEGSAGWCAMIGCDSGYITAFLDEDVAHEMYPDISVATAATATATGQATPVRGGYRVNGRWLSALRMGVGRLQGDGKRYSARECSRDRRNPDMFRAALRVRNSRYLVYDRLARHWQSRSRDPRPVRPRRTHLQFPGSQPGQTPWAALRLSADVYCEGRRSRAGNRPARNRRGDRKCQPQTGPAYGYR